MEIITFLAVFYRFYEVICSGWLYLLSVASYAFDGDRFSKNQRSVNYPTSVNYHFTRKCNYKCGFCFHTAKTSFVLPIDEAKRGLCMLKKSGKPFSNEYTYTYNCRMCICRLICCSLQCCMRSLSVFKRQHTN